MDKILKKAISTYGEDSQINMAIQEMAELIKELTDFYRNRTTKEKLATELADVQITLKQLEFIFEDKYRGFLEEVEKEKKRKLKRLENNLK